MATASASASSSSTVPSLSVSTMSSDPWTICSPSLSSRPHTPTSTTSSSSYASSSHSLDRGSLRELYDSLDLNAHGRLDLREMLKVEREIIEGRNGEWNPETKLEELLSIVEDEKDLENGFDFEAFHWAIMRDLDNTAEFDMQHSMDFDPDPDADPDDPTISPSKKVNFVRQLSALQSSRSPSAKTSGTSTPFIDPSSSESIPQRHHSMSSSYSCMDTSSVSSVEDSPDQDGDTDRMEESDTSSHETRKTRPSRNSVSNNTKSTEKSNGDMTAQLEASYSLISRRDEDLRVALHNGPSLIDKNDDVAKKMVDLETLFEMQRRELEQVKRDRRAIDKKRWYLQTILDESQARDVTLNATIDQLKMRLKLQKRKYAELEQSLNQQTSVADAKISELRQQLEDLKNENTKLAISKQQFSDWFTAEKAHLAETMTELVEVREEVERLRKVELVYKRLQKETAENEHDAKSSADYKAKVESLTAELAQLTHDHELLLKTYQTECGLFQSAQFELNHLQQQLAQQRTETSRTIIHHTPRSVSLADDLGEQDITVAYENAAKDAHAFAMNGIHEKKQVEPAIPLNAASLFALSSSTTTTSTSLSTVEEMEKEENKEIDKTTSTPPTTIHVAPLSHQVTRQLMASATDPSLSTSTSAASASATETTSPSTAPSTLDILPSSPFTSLHADVTTNIDSTMTSDEQQRLKYRQINAQFFFLTALSIRLGIESTLPPSILHPKPLESSTSSVPMLSPLPSTSTLYARAMSRRIPFHQYARWIDHELQLSLRKLGIIMDKLSPSTSSSNNTSAVQTPTNGVRSLSHTHTPPESKRPSINMDPNTMSALFMHTNGSTMSPSSPTESKSDHSHLKRLSTSSISSSHGNTSSKQAFEYAKMAPTNSQLDLTPTDREREEREKEKERQKEKEEKEKTTTKKSSGFFSWFD